MRKSIYEFKQLKRFLDNNALKTIYHTNAISILKYVVVTWESGFESCSDPLSVDHKWIIKINLYVILLNCLFKRLKYSI